MIHLKIFLVEILLFISVKSKPTKLTNCKALLDDGSIIDLTSLNNPVSPRTASDDTYSYKFNPCSPISCGSQYGQETASICKVDANSNYYDIGDQSNSDFDYDGTSLSISYYSGISTSVVKCMCSPTELFEFLGQDPASTAYQFNFYSPCCCPNGCQNFVAPVKINNCKAQLGPNYLIDLSPLDNSNNPMFTPSSYYNFYYNPCTGFQCDPTSSYSSSAVCQRSQDGSISYDIGDQDSVSFSLDSSNSLVLTYSSDEKSSTINCICSDENYFQFIMENPANNYILTMANPFCCPIAISSDDAEYYLLIPIGIAFCIFLAAYFIGCCICSRLFKRKLDYVVIPQFELIN